MNFSVDWIITTNFLAFLNSVALILVSTLTTSYVLF